MVEAINHAREGPLLCAAPAQEHPRLVLLWSDILALFELLFSREGMWDHRCLVLAFLTY